MKPGTAIIGGAAVVATACAGPATAELSEIPRENPTTTRHTREQDAPDATEPATTTTAVEITVATLPPWTYRPPAPEPVDVDLDEDEWWDRERVLRCIRLWESDTAGGYRASNGVNEGAYQFDQGTWDGAVTRAGHPEWAGRDPKDAPAHVQDDAAWQLFGERGYQPWPTPLAMCGGG